MSIDIFSSRLVQNCSLIYYSVSGTHCNRSLKMAQCSAIFVNIENINLSAQKFCRLLSKIINIQFVYTYKQAY